MSAALPFPTTLICLFFFFFVWIHYSSTAAWKSARLNLQVEIFFLPVAAIAYIIINWTL